MVFKCAFESFIPLNMKNEKVPIRIGNQLAIHRKRRSMTPKTVARALGHGSTSQISRYERGATIPPLDVAIKLGIIYGIPIQTLFDGYFEKCSNELNNWKDVLPINTVATDEKSRPKASEFCSYEAKLTETYVTQIEDLKISGHIANLIRQRAGKLGHI